MIVVWLATTRIRTHRHLPQHQQVAACARINQQGRAHAYQGPRKKSMHCAIDVCAYLGRVAYVRPPDDASDEWPGLRFGQKLNSGAPRALDPSRLVGIIEDFGLDEADRSPTSTKPNKTQGPWSQVPWVILRRG